MLYCEYICSTPTLSCKFFKHLIVGSSASCDLAEDRTDTIVFFFFKGSWSKLGYSESLSNYRAGFNDCANKVCSFMENQPSLDNKLREQILVRLASSCSPCKSDTMYYSSGVPVPEMYATESPYCYVPSPPPSPPSSAFSPFKPCNRAVTSIASDTGMKTSGEQQSAAHMTRTSMDSTKSVIPEECKNALWRPWMPSSAENGEI